MKGVIFAFAVSSFLTSTKGECPAYDSLVTSCEGATKYGPIVQVDFHKINRPCTCIVTPLFAGELLVISRGRVFPCHTQVYFQNIIFPCSSDLLSQSISVTINQSLDVRAEYVSTSTSGTFYHCMVFLQNDGSNGNLSVICGSSLATELPITTTSTTTTTTIATPSTATSRLSSEVSSTKPTAAIIQNDVNVTESTGTTLSEECTFICGRKDKVTGNCESHLSLQIPLAIFVVISIVSTITNIYFYIHIKLRKKSGSNASNVKVSFQTTTEPTAETYTELGNTVSENQYDSLSDQDNYMNTNVS
nr:P cell-type agglutination protein map4-like isoform X2 [Crassostrea gigas]